METKALILITVTMTMLGMALGASHTVGAPHGSWDIQTNYSQWVSKIRFTTGDELKFQYSAAVHNVVEVSKTGYDSCNGSSPISTFPTGNDVVPLATIGTRYFICGVSGHCNAGMKVEVNVKSKEVRTVQRCRRTGNRRRCQSETVLSLAMSAGVDQSTVARLGLIVVAAGLMLFF
ncbi:uclacyanin 1-like [Triticum dicoccoides]|uniref:uclacyanin 1-like n=1 Tax=Triticum dicoccoides TaxID=85692 RepID=UPI0018909826|nr:uclacyanin 1-like [Triticum dicoccoides]